MATHQTRLERFSTWIAALLTSRRLKHYPLIYLVLSWVAVSVSIALGNLPIDAFGNPVAVDLSNYVTGAKLVLSGDASRLYDLPLQRDVQHEILMHAAPDYFNVYIAPPFFTYVYAPIALVPYSLGALIWSALTITLLALSVRLLWPLVPNLHRFGFIPTFMIVLASPPGFELITSGQNSALSLFLVVAALRLIIRKRGFAAGSLLGAGVFKPQLFVLFPVLFIAEKRWNALAGWVATASLLTAFSVWMVGIQGVRMYANLLTSPLYEKQVLEDLGWKMGTVGGLVRVLLPPEFALGNVTTAINAVALIAGGLLIVQFQRAIRKRYTGAEATMLSFSAAVLIASVFAPHAFIYDNILLMVPIMVLLNQFPASNPLRACCAVAYVVALSAPIRYFAYDQFSWPLSIIGGPLTMLPILLLVYVAYRSISSEPERGSAARSEAHLPYKPAVAAH